MSPRLPTASSLSPKMETLAIPSQRRRPAPHPRQRSSGPIGPLRLPSLPRFHPANFPSSQHTSAANTPVTGPNSPQPPVSPRTQQRQYSDAQRQLYLYQRELVSTARGGCSSVRTPSGMKPASPKLMPLAGSPGPVTPLELETQDGYLLAGQASGVPVSDRMKGELVDKLIQEEARRRNEATHSSRMAPVASR